MVTCPAEGEWLGIRFRLGTFTPDWLPGHLVDRRDVTLPDATTRSFWLKGSAWEYPDFADAEAFVARLAKRGVIARDASVSAVVQGQQDSDRRKTREAGFHHHLVKPVDSMPPKRRF